MRSNHHEYATPRWCQIILWLVIGSGFFAFACLAQGKEDTVKNIGQYASDRAVTVSTDAGHGTGTIIGTNLVLTCFHNLHVDSDIKVNDKVAKVIAVAPQYDLVVLGVETGEFAPITFAETSNMHQAFYFGDPGEHKHIAVAGAIVDSNDKYLFVDVTIINGASGSGLYTKDGLVGIMVAMEIVNGMPVFGIATRSSVIQKFLAGQ